MKTIPRFSLYGNDTAAPAWHHLVDFEHIPERSGRFHWEISPHVHDVLLQVLYITRGGGEATIEGRTWSLAPPCLVLVPAGSVHAFSFRPDVDGPVVTAAQRPLEAMARQLAPELLPLLRQSTVLRVDPLGAPARALPALFEALEREVRGGSDDPSDRRPDGGYVATVGGEVGRAAAALALLTAVLVQAARVSVVQAAAEGDPHSRKVQQVERFKALVEAHFRARWPVSRYAAALNVSAGQLGRLTREVLGCSPLDAVNERIVREAQRELVHASAGVKQVAAALGFDDDAYFGRFFKKHTGLRPGEFRMAGRRQVGNAGEVE
ncbi:MAG: helix-turn-helix domain-containing protein [Rubrivivax sp.]|nr:helix-turn-helix domain-containing protein [Rubrivivax sp.]